MNLGLVRFFTPVVCVYLGVFAVNSTLTLRVAEINSNTTGIAVRDTAGDTVHVRALDDQNNPFREQYGAWDVWLYEHMERLPDDAPQHVSPDPQALMLQSLQESINRPANWTGLQTRLTSKGYLQPVLEGIKQNEYQRGSADLMAPGAEQWISAHGLMDPQTYKQMHTAVDALKASYYQPIPRWLAENPPEAAMLMPNGDVVTSGLLGSGARVFTESGGVGPRSALLARYDKEGKLVRQVDGADWWYLYYPGGVADRPAGAIAISNDGYVEFTAQPGWNVLSRWDWDGTPLALDAPRPARDYHPFQFLMARAIIDYYAATH